MRRRSQREEARWDEAQQGLFRVLPEGHLDEGDAGEGEQASLLLIEHLSLGEIAEEALVIVLGGVRETPEGRRGRNRGRHLMPVELKGEHEVGKEDIHLQRLP